MIMTRLKHHLQRNKNKLIKNMLSSCAMIIILNGISPTIVWAFFTNSVSTGVQTIKTATYNKSVTIIDSKGDTITDNKGEYILSNGTYNVQLEALGTASTGYFNIVLNESNYFTNQVPTDEGNNFINIELTINSNEPVKVSFIANWGICSLSDNEKINDKIVYGNVNQDIREPLDNSIEEIEILEKEEVLEDSPENFTLEIIQDTKVE